MIVGAGPAGCLLSHYLLRRGFSVHLFEKRASALPPRPGISIYVLILLIVDPK